MERIFVAEDDESIREELKTLLEANGYKAVDAPPCDLALLDVNLPGENGFEICRKLRMHSDVPVIFLTARDSAEDEIVGFGVGADDYIRKPYNSSVLLMRIARLCRDGDRGHDGGDRAGFDFRLRTVFYGDLARGKAEGRQRLKNEQPAPFMQVI